MKKYKFLFCDLDGTLIKTVSGKTFYSLLAARNLTWDAYNKELLQGNYTYFYPKNGHYYTKRNTLKCKDIRIGEWYDAILYSDNYGQYVRELNDFNTKFKKL